MKNKISFFLASLALLSMSMAFAEATVDTAPHVWDGGRESFTDHVTTYQENSAPKWKKIWDQARVLYGKGKYEQARIKYEQLLSRKDNIDQARWEYVTVLMAVKQWHKAAIELGRLSNDDPGRSEYELARAEIALGQGDFEEAIKIYKPRYDRCYATSDHTGDKADILIGYIAALEGLKKWDTLSPLLEELIRLRPDDSALQKKAAAIALKNNHHRRALLFLDRLAENNPDDSSIFQQMALIHESLGETERAAACWQEVVGLNADCRQAHEKLIKYYQKVGNKAMELKHIQALLRLQPADKALLERSAQLHLDMNRPDHALENYNLLLSLQPGSSEIIHRKKLAVQQVAIQLLSLVENSGSSMLWQDLVQVTADRTEVFRNMATLLRGDETRRNELIEVLRVINDASPGDIAIRDELATLLHEQGRDDILATVMNMDSGAPVNLRQ